jgi:hypothetical protein
LLDVVGHAKEVVGAEVAMEGVLDHVDIGSAGRRKDSDGEVGVERLDLVAEIEGGALAPDLVKLPESEMSTSRSFQLGRAYWVPNQA